MMSGATLFAACAVGGGVVVWCVFMLWLDDVEMRRRRAREEWERWNDLNRRVRLHGHRH